VAIGEMGFGDPALRWRERVVHERGHGLGVEAARLGLRVREGTAEQSFDREIAIRCHCFTFS
jgi:hypothetical protein